MSVVRTKYVKDGYSEIGQPITLEETSQTKTVLKCALTPKGVRGTIWRQKKNDDGTFSEENEIDFRSADKNYGVRIDIPSDGLKNLINKLYLFFSVRKEFGVEFGEQEYVLANKEDIIKITDKNKANAIKDLIQKGYSQDFLNKLKEIDPSQIENISKLQILEKRTRDLQEFEEQIEGDKNENYWQDFFEKRKWIFGYGLNYQILKQVEGQPYYGGQSIDRTGAQIGDFMSHTEGYNRYTVLIEIKTPQTRLLRGEQPNRSGTWSLSQNLTDAVTQLQANIDTWNTRGSRDPDNSQLLYDQNIYTITPKGILVIGKQDELDNHEKRRTFERLRQSIHGIEIVTFDELKHRAEFILNEDTDNNSDS